MSRAASADVVVVGGGAIGACVALEMVRRGASVVLLERGERLAAGCSAGSAGLVTPSHVLPLGNRAALRDGARWLLSRDAPFRVRPRPGVLPWLARYVWALASQSIPARERLLRQLSLESLALHRTLASEGLETGFEVRGTLNVFEDESAYAAEIAHAQSVRAFEIGSEVLRGSEAREFEPALRRTPAGAVYYPDDALCHSSQFVHAIGQAAAEGGARLEARVEVHGFRRRGVRIDAVRSTAGDISAGHVVLAAGVWTRSLARSLGILVPLEAGKGFHVDFSRAATDPSVPIWLHGSRVVVTPLADRLRIAGILELAGLDLRLDRKRSDGLTRSATAALVGLEGRRVLETWCGLRPCSPDDVPIIGRPAGLENLVLATGHGMGGLDLAPITGRLVAQLLAHEPPTVELSLCNPDRFHVVKPLRVVRRSRAAAVAPR